VNSKNPDRTGDGNGKKLSLKLLFVELTMDIQLDNVNIKIKNRLPGIHLKSVRKS
jgi:hypothetical protein